MNHREGERVATDIPVTVYGPDRGPIQTRMRDVSLSGAGIDCPEGVGVDPMDLVEIWMSLPLREGLEPVRIAGFVVRRSSGRLGVMFMDETPWLPRRLREAAVGRKSRGRRISAPPVLSGMYFSDS